MFNVQRQSISLNIDVSFSTMITSLVEAGFEPLLIQAKQQYFGAVGEDNSIQAIVSGTRSIPLTSYYSYSFRSRLPIMPEEGINFPDYGELFHSPQRNGFLYILSTDLTIRNSEHRKSVERPHVWEIGYIGHAKENECLDKFDTVVTEIINQHGVEIEWDVLDIRNSTFMELENSSEAEFTTASTLSKEDLELASILEDQEVRELAVTVRRSGGILAADLARKASKQDETLKIVEQLINNGLLSREYVVICRRTSNQINRVKERSAIAQMDAVGVLCSCGKAISEERIEELYSPTTALQRMLDQSYWTTAKLVAVLQDLGVPEDRVLLNLREGAEEIDAFVDIDSTLIMFELKDNEFSMGHAYPFSGRIGMYKPNYAVIVATKGIAPEVREYFNRVMPQTEIVYIGHLRELSSVLENIVNKIRSRSVMQFLELFNPMAAIQIRISNILSARLGIDVDNTEEDDEDLPF